MDAAVLDGQGIVLVTNRAWRVGGICCLGITDPVTPGTSLVEKLDGIVGPKAQDAAALRAGLREVYDQQVEQFSRRVCDQGGGNWQEITVRSFADPTGVRRLLLTRADITAEQRVDRALHDTERRYRAVVESQTEMICRFLPDTTLTFVNEAYSRHFGRTSAQLLGRSFLELVPDDVHDSVRQELKKLTPSDPINTKTHRVRRVDGTLGWQTWTDRALFDDQQRLVELQSVGRDVTERIEAQKKIRESEQRYRAASEGGLDAFYLFEAERDASGRVVDFRFLDLNEKGAAIISRQREDVVGQSMLKLLPVNRGEQFFPTYVRVLESGESLFDEFEIHAADEGIQPTWMERQVVPVGDGISISARDITARKATEQALEQQRNQNQIILNAIPAMVFYKDAYNRILRVNKAAAEAQGISVKEMEGRPTADFYPEFADSFYEDDLAVMASGQAKLGYLEKVDRPGGQGPGWIRTDKVPVYDDQGAAEGVLAIATDVSELIETTEKLRESEQRFRDLFDRVPVAVMEQDMTEVGRWWKTCGTRASSISPEYLQDHPDELVETSRLTFTADQ